MAIYHCYAKTPIGSAVAFTAVAVYCRVDESVIEIGTVADVQGGTIGGVIGGE